jgi:hypothetical protein
MLKKEDIKKEISVDTLSVIALSSTVRFFNKKEAFL